MKRLLIACLLVGVAFYGISKLDNTPTKPEQPKEPCTQSACIRITEETGKQYDLNDFRFMPNQCISFISLPDNVNRSTCGKYKLDWIGPETTKVEQL